MEIKITTLSENTSAGVMAEWGLSMLLEADGRKILFDTGAGLAAVYNANLMGIALSSAESIVISHGHHDHTGGLRVFDVTDPTAPEPDGYFETPYANSVFVTDTHVFVADRDMGLVILEEE